MPKGFTQEDVFGAADTLLARGERPTIERVRQEIGRGSPNTVNPLLDAWWGSLSARIRNENQPDDRIPATLMEAIYALFEQLRQAALAQADMLLGERRQDLDFRTEQLTNLKLGLRPSTRG